MKNIKTFESFIAEGLSVRDNGIRDGILFIDINGNEYGYSEIKGGADLEEIARKFRKMLQFSSGRALAWLKKNTDLAAGSKKNEAEDIKAAIGSMVSEVEVAELLESLTSKKPNDVETIELDMAWDDSDKEEDKAAKEAFKKYKIKVEPTENDGTYEVTGKKKDILAYLQSEFYEMDAGAIKEYYPELLESHFKVGDKVKMSHGGVGTVVALDKEDGAEDEAYYSIELANGDVMKHAPNELEIAD